ncbi:glucose-6-phosphate 1-dehydrogenase [Polymorphobacter multimanifer]|uniref:Glucose-6-phosphate 1-dehydrogenase n=2 Tax=Polymorphobacter multimanifer TaxID=1070431 RepID=A0A841L465_9SPHN|nr:glucose-6-phosphate 1-dehydrogenase [Polymorphobacter multimanifer]
MSACTHLLLFGATGDLARRMLLPSLFALDTEGLLPQCLRIIATARSAHDDASFQALAADTLPEAADPQARSRFLARLSYVALDASDQQGFAALAEAVPDRGNLAIFLSTAPALFGATIAGLASAGLAGPGARLALEKPLGDSLAASRTINDAVAAAYPEDRTFRIDHYLGKETVQNLMGFRFANTLFEPLWNAAHIAHVQISIGETVGLEGRGDYYDGMGALRDMVQNHMLQLVALLAMEPPARLDPASVRDEKVKVLRSLRPIDAASVEACSVRGQYTAGAIDGVAVPGYTADLGRASDTETFVALKAYVDNWRWKGVPFYLRTGKRAPERLSEIIVQFRAVPHSIFGAAPLAANKLVITLQPDENIRLSMMAKAPGLDQDGLKLRELPLDIGLPNAFAESRRRIAYERLLLDLIEGRQTLFVRRDEVEAQWQWIDAIRAGWAARGMAARPHSAGTWGPSAAIALTERDDVTWHD